jgi:hypothetical protein
MGHPGRLGWWESGKARGGDGEKQVAAGESRGTVGIFWGKPTGGGRQLHLSTIANRLLIEKLLPSRLFVEKRFCTGVLCRADN